MGVGVVPSENGQACHEQNQFLNTKRNRIILYIAPRSPKNQFFQVGEMENDYLPSKALFISRHN